ncbi:RagB/SusD family nutrient uptake outer membrane protein [Christiangramia sp. SM2212]|uniref:RagB/SusD family nutrient uptake outer membrane protein n=1 Tax=Christiangramia sediminicola TaxID=3073267 RepID=A0ABU1ENP5_9FLAO|nr:RagB/SusD family nutrient uptake outer membrane protein [Christiangramia sp. SM2212]MDR5590010.1 RagB/SusD family nutrient uptake outer membrane protein [Christiangramia sp. SM2212]
MKNNRFNIILLGLALSLGACTDLDIEETDSRIANQTGEFTGVADVEGALTSVYNSVRGQMENQANLYALNEVSSDEFVVPTRGTDWGDNGLWRTLHQHTWSAIHPHVRDTWNEQNQNVFNTTEIIDSRSQASPSQEAEARFLRALSMFWVMDLYGQVPFREVDEGIDIDPRVLSRQEAFDFIENDLLTALSDLPNPSPGDSELNFASQAAANHLLAKLYLNKHIYYGSESPSSADMQLVIDNVNALEDKGFGLVEGYFDIFAPALDNETIFFTTSSVGNVIWHGLHYNQNAPDNTGGGWNGFTTLAEFYDSFEGDPNTNFVGDGQEERRGFVPDETTANDVNFGIGYGFLVGQQYDDDGSKLKTRQNTDLMFSKNLPGLVGNGEDTGIRVIKYHPTNGSFANHKIVFRFSDAYLMKAEAMMRMGDDATGMVNELRALRKASPLSSVTEEDLLAERGRELYGEYWRRNDLIRFGTFSDTWGFKDNTENFRVLFPIPSSAIISNPNLTQNEGY